MRSRLSVLVLVMVVAVAVSGCGRDPDHELKRAQIALQSNSLDNALELANSVLEVRPDDVDALMVRAEAQMRMLNFKASHDTLNRLLELSSDPERTLHVRRLLVTWCFAKTINILRQSDFDDNKDLQREFDDTLAIGEEQARWLADQPGRLAESHYCRARLALRDVSRLERQLTWERKNLENITPDGRLIEGPGTVIGNLKAKLTRSNQAARSYLESALKENPKEYDAAWEYVRMLREGGDWPALWQYANQIAEVGGIPERLAAELVLAVLQMPSSQQASADRVAVGWKIQNNVPSDRQKTATWQIASARLHVQAGEFAKAQPLLEQAMKSQGRDLNVPYLLARTYMGLNQPQKAQDVLEKVMNLARDNAQMQLVYGAVLIQTGQTTQAKEALRRATELDPENAQARALLIDLMAQENQLQAVEQDVQKLLDDSPNDPRALRMKLNFEQARGGREQIAELLVRIEKITPSTPEHLEVLVDGYNYLQQFDRTERVARRLVEQKPDAIESHLALAGAMLSQGKDDQVVTLLGELREKFPKAASIDQMLGRLYLQRQKFDRAQEALEKVVEAEPTNIEARLMLAQALVSLSMPEEALEQIDRVLEQAPSNAQAHSLAAMTHQIMGNRHKADEHLAQVSEEAVNEREAPVLKAQLLIRKGDLDAAAAVCNRAISAGRTDPALRRLLASIYLQQRQPEQAEFHLLAMVRAEPNNPLGYVQLARFYLDQKLIDKGLSEIAKLQTLNEPLSRLAQASLYASDGRHEQAIGVLQPILDPLIQNRDRTAVAIVEAMVRTYTASNKLAEAEATLQRLIDADLNANHAQFLLIELRQQPRGSDTPEQTVAKLDSLVQRLTPEQDRLRATILRKYASLGRHDRVVSVLDQWIAQRPDSWRLLELKSQALERMNQPKLAVPVLEKAISMAPEHVGLRIRLAMMHMASFDYPAAEKVLRDAANIDAGARITSLAGLAEMYLGLGLSQRAAETFDELERVGRATDPRVILTMGRALSAMGQRERAMDRLGEVPEYAPQFPFAQIEMARIEQNQGRLDAARDRLEKLAMNQRFAAMASKELLRFADASGQPDELLKWVDRTLAVERLPARERDGWLRARVWIAAEAGQWELLATTLDRLIELNPDQVDLAAARVAVLLRQQKPEAARAALNASPALRASDFGRLLCAAIGLDVESPDKAPALDQFLIAMTQQNPAAAGSFVDMLPPFRTMFRDDLRAFLARPDAGSVDTATAFKNLVVAVVALRTGIPQLTAEICNSLIKTHPGLLPAYSLRIDAMIRLKEPVKPIFEAIRERLGTTSVALMVAAKAKLADGDAAAAVKDFQQLLEREPNNVHIQYELVNAYQAAAQWEQAIALLEKIWATPGPYRLLAGNDLAYLLAVHQPQRLAEAAAMARTCYEANPTNVALLDTLGWIAYKQGRHDEALAHLARAIAGLKDLPEVQYHLGCAYLAKGNAVWAKYHLAQAASNTSGKPEVKAAQDLLAQQP